MDLKQYFRKMREIESTIPEPFVLIVSLETPDGGKPGMVTEVSRVSAAKMIIEGRAVLANESEKQAYFAQQEAARRAAEKLELSKRVQVAILADPELGNATAGKKNSDSPSTRK
jgi:hypothetical protein